MGPGGRGITQQKTRKGLITAERFAVNCYLFTLKLMGPVQLPVFKGDVFHRALGRGLEQISPRFGRYFFKPEKPKDWPDPKQTPPKPYMLVPPLTAQTRFSKGDEVELGVTLFGEARQHFMTVFAALEKLGSTSGISNGKGKFIVREVSQVTHTGLLQIFNGDQWPDAAQPVSAADIFTVTPSAASKITIETLTKLRLKDHGQLVRKQLSLAVLTDRLIGRINTLSAMYCGGLILPPEEKTALVTLARTATIKRDNTRWEDWNGSDKYGAIKFGGLAGSIAYVNVPAVLLPWLNLGQWIGVGGKTSFGLGSYSLEIEEYQ